jgi:AraC family ethanolamine operon transcriptional activator
MVEQGSKNATQVWKQPYGRHCAMVAEVDELVRLLPPSTPLYSRELARQIGTSVRTLHAASVSAAGMSLHRYLRLKRLSRVRLQLSTGAFSVKSAALANGFWHLGDFSRVYSRAFGEMPSQTRARAKARQVGQVSADCFNERPDRAA